MRIIIQASSEKCFFIICKHWLWFKLLKTFSHQDQIGQISVQNKNMNIINKGAYLIVQFRNKVCKQDRKGAHECLRIYSKRKQNLFQMEFHTYMTTCWLIFHQGESFYRYCLHLFPLEDLQSHGKTVWTKHVDDHRRQSGWLRTIYLEWIHSDYSNF